MSENTNPNVPFRGGFRPMIEGSGEPHLAPYAAQLASNPESGGGNQLFKSFKCNVCYSKLFLLFSPCDILFVYSAARFDDGPVWMLLLRKLLPRLM